jgi:outer membrane biosynthesis protein TonB
MSNFFVLTFLLSVPAFFLGLVNPKWVAAPNRKRSAAIYGGLMAGCFLLVGITAPGPVTKASVTPPLAAIEPPVEISTPEPSPEPVASPDPSPAVEAPTPTPEPSPVAKAAAPTPEVKPSPKPESDSSEAKVKAVNFPSCVNSDCNCSDFTTRAAAQRVLEAFPGDPFKLDRDRDGIACETLP